MSAKIDKKRLELSLNKIIDGEVNIKENVTLSDWLCIKEAISPVNNYVSHELTMLFINNVDRFVDGISKQEKSRLQQEYENKSANSPGYDVVFEGEKIKLIAEVKANVRFEKKGFGSMQKTQLKKDVDGLLNGKSTSPIKPADFLKIQVMLDYNNGIFSTKKAVEEFCAKEMNVQLLADKLTSNSDRTKVYFVLISDLK